MCVDVESSSELVCILPVIAAKAHLPFLRGSQSAHFDEESESELDGLRQREKEAW